MHLANKIIHSLQGFSRRGNQEVNTGIDNIEIRVGDHNRYFDQSITSDVQSGHLAIDPYQWFFQITHSFKCKRMNRISLSGFSKSVPLR